jgi:hypothetical protein
MGNTGIVYDIFLLVIAILSYYEEVVSIRLSGHRSVGVFHDPLGLPLAASLVWWAVAGDQDEIVLDTLVLCFSSLTTQWVATDD